MPPRLGSGREVPAVRVKTPPPSYPQAMRPDGISGVVAIKVVINEKGEVKGCNVSKSAALKAINRRSKQSNAGVQARQQARRRRQGALGHSDQVQVDE